MTFASAVIVGGGVLGASAAYHLAAAGWKDLRLLDRHPRPGMGSTGKSTGGFRAQFATPVNVRLSLLSREKLIRFPDEIGADPGYHPAGYLWVAETAEEMEELRAGLRTQRDNGLSEAREVGAGEVLEIQPHLAAGKIIGGAFCPTDGFIRPMDILEGYLAAAARLGVRIEWGVEVTDLETGPGGGIVRVHTSQGVIACQAVVNAAGAWAAPLAELAGASLPVQPVKRQVAATFPFHRLPPETPMTIFSGTGFHLRSREGRVLLLRPDPPGTGDPFDTRVEAEWLVSVLGEARRRVPALGDVEVDAGASWAGLYEMSPDRHVLLGASPQCENLFLINGASGHGVMHAPALGQLLAEIVCSGKPRAFDATALRPSRFAEGEANPCGGLL